MAAPTDTTISIPSPPQSIILTPLETPATILTVGGNIIGGNSNSNSNNNRGGETTVQEVLIISTNSLLPQQQHQQQQRQQQQIGRTPATRDISSTGGVMTGC